MKISSVLRLPVVCAVLFLAAAPAAGQSLPDGELSGEISASRVFGSDLRGVDAEDEDSGSSFILRGALDYEIELGNIPVALSYDTAGYFYDEDDRSDRWSNRGALGVTHDLTDGVQLFGQAGYASNIATAESGSTDQSELLGGLQFAFGEANRVRTSAGYRWREYDFDESEGQGAFFGAQYRYRFAANHYLTAEARRENINSDTLRRGYDRTTAELFYQRSLSPGLRLRTGAIARWWDFDGRFAPTAERLERRTITPEVDLQYATRPGWLLRGRLQQIFRGSNDPRFAEDEQRATVTAGYRF